MKVLVVGGMGIIGSAITEAACKKDYDVYILSRRDINPYFLSMGVIGLKGDCKDDEFVIDLLSNNFDVIVDTLIFNKNDLQRDVKLVNNNCKHFIFISTDAVYNHPAIATSEDTTIDQSKLDWDYGRNKRQAEVELDAHGNDYSFAWTVVRPTMTYGDRRIPVGFGSRKNEWSLIERIYEGKPVINFDSGCLHAMCHAITFGDAVTELFLNEKAYGSFFHVSDDNAIRYKEVYNKIGEFIGREPIVINSNICLLKALNQAKYVEMLFDKNPEFTLDNSKIKAIATNVEYAVDLKNAIESEVGFLKENFSSMPEDKEYNMLTDAILLSYKKMNLTNTQVKQVSEYISSLSREYKRSLNTYQFKCQCKSFMRPIYRLLKGFFHIS